MAVKVTRAKRVAKRRVQNSGSARAKAHDAKPLARPRRQDQEAATVRVSRETLRQLRSRLRDAQHAVVRAPNREIPMRGYGPIAALMAYDGIQDVVERLDNLLEVQP